MIFLRNDDVVLQNVIVHRFAAGVFTLRRLFASCLLRYTHLYVSCLRRVS
jgi:hypothetical protein